MNQFMHNRVLHSCQRLWGRQILAIRISEHPNDCGFFVGIPMNVTQRTGSEVGLLRHYEGDGPSLELEALLPELKPLMQVSFRTGLEICLPWKPRRQTRCYTSCKEKHYRHRPGRDDEPH